MGAYQKTRIVHVLAASDRDGERSASPKDEKKGFSRPERRGSGQLPQS